MTFAERLVSEAGRRWGFAVVVQGVPVVAVRGVRDLSTPLPTALLDLAWPMPGGVELVEVEIAKLDQAKKSIDLVQRRMVGGSLTVGLIDDDAGTLAALFTPRSRHTTRVGADIDDSATPAAQVLLSTGAIEDPATSASGLGHLYVGAETILIDSIASSTTVSVVERGAYGSRAQPHLGGEPVYNVPPSWLGRRVKLLGFFIEDDGSVDAATGVVLDTFRLEEPPTPLGPDQWELRGSHLSDEIAEKKMGIGLRDVDGMGFRIQPGASAGEQAFVSAYGTSPFTLGAYPTFIRLSGRSQRVVVTGTTARQGDELVTVHEVLSLSGVDVVFRAASEVDAGDAVTYASAARHIAILRNGSPGVLAAIALSSRLGDGSNGTYDALPGVESATLGADEWFMGAGIPSSEIDIDAFIDVGWSAPWWTYVIDDEIEVGDFLREFCIVTESFWSMTSSGALTVTSLARRAEAPTTTISDLVGAEPIVLHDEESVLPRVKIACSYNTLTQEFEESITIVDVEMAKRYPQRQDVYEIESRAVHITPHRRGTPRLAAPQITIAQVEGFLRRLMVEDRRGRAIVSFATHLDGMTVELGEVIGVAFPDLPDLAGGTLTDGRARVLALHPDYDAGMLHVEAQVLDRSFAIAPAAVIASVAGFTITLRTTGPEVASATPARMFGNTWNLLIHDISGGTSYMVYGTTTGDTTILLGALPPFAIEVGVDYVTVADQADSDYVDANTSGLTPDDFVYQMPDDEVDGVDEFPTRWG